MRHLITPVYLFVIKLGVCGCQPSPQPAPSPPANIVFILADDLGYNELSCYGQDMFETPHIDQLAAEGMRFTDFYAGNTVCAPSRCALMTGKQPGRASIRGNWGWPNGYDSKQRVGITAQDSTLGELMQQAGYATAHVGKWHLLTENDREASWPIHRGYDFVMREHFTAPVKAARQAHLEATGIRYDPNYPYEFWRNGERVPIEANATGEQRYLMDDIITDAGMQFIREHQQKPFFVFFSLKIPHSPETLHTFDTLFREKGWPECERVHAARIVYHDQQVGKIVSLIDSLGLGENTLILYSSDNGGHSEGAYKHPSVDPCQHDHTFFRSNAPLRGYKRDLYEGGLRVPFIARWPGKIKAGALTSHVGAFWDVWATLADLTGVSSTYAHDGISFLPTLRGETQVRHEQLYWEFYLNQHNGVAFRQALRQGPWKAVRYGLDEPIELYHLDEDIGEQRDLAAEQPERVQAMAAQFEAMHEGNEFFPYGGIPSNQGLAPHLTE